MDKNRPDNRSHHNMKKSLIIIGAGAAGLMAASKLSPQYEVTILEAQPQVGGRIHSIQVGDIVIEAGAEFVHGNLPVTLGLLDKAGIPYVKVEGNMYRRVKGQLAIVEDMVEGWDGLLKKMGAVQEDITLDQLLDTHYVGSAYALLREHAKKYAAGFDLADSKTVSVRSLYKEWSAEEVDNYRIPGGYSRLMDYLLQECQKAGATIVTGSIVKKVHWQKDSVEVTLADGTTYKANQLLVTVPVIVFQQPGSSAAIGFQPPLHFDHLTAEEIGFGHVIKVVLQFKKNCWPEDAGFIFSDELFPTWWTQLPSKSTLLTGWAGGPHIAELSAEPDVAILEKALTSLSLILDKTVPQLKELLTESHIFNWQQNEFALGGYSFAKPGTAAARRLINTPMEDTIFFAGEGYYEGDHPGTVEAALQSGIAAAELLANCDGEL